MKVSVKFGLKNLQTPEKQAVICYVRSAGIRASIVVNDLEVNQEDWKTVFSNGDIVNAHQKLVTNRLLKIHADQICRLFNIIQEINEIHFSLAEKSNGKNIVSEYKRYLKKLKNLDINNRCFDEFIDRFIQRAKKFPSQKTGRTLSRHRISQFKKFKSLFSEFCEYAGMVNYFQNFTFDFLDDFILWMDEEKDYHHNTIFKYQKVLSQVFDAANIAGIYPQWKYHKNKIHRLVEIETLNIALTNEELKLLMKLELKNKEQDQVRDWFVIGAFTACRFKDLMNLRKENIKEGYLYYNQQKSGDKNKVCLPIEDEFSVILEKYEQEHTGFPKVATLQRFNLLIKQICAQLPLMRQKANTSAKNGLGKVKLIETKRYLQVSSHTMRRTYATRLHLSGIPAEQIMSATGHKQVATFMKYIKLSNRGRAEVLNNSIQKTKIKSTRIRGVLASRGKIIIDLHEFQKGKEQILELLENIA